MNRREIAIIGGTAVLPGALLLSLLFGSSPHHAPDTPAPAIVHQLPEWQPPPPAAQVPEVVAA